MNLLRKISKSNNKWRCYWILAMADLGPESAILTRHNNQHIIFIKLLSLLVNIAHVRTLVPFHNSYSDVVYS